MREAASASAKALEAAERGLDEHTSAFLAFCGKYVIDVQNKRDARLRLRFGELDPDTDPAPEFPAKTAFRMWTDAKQDAARFQRATVEWRRPDGDRRAVDTWRLLAQRPPTRGSRVFRFAGSGDTLLPIGNQYVLP